MRISEKSLRNKIINALESQGFYINPHLRPKKNEKYTLRKIHKQKRNEQLKLHKNFLLTNFKEIKEFSIDGKEIEPEKIDLELIEVKPNSFESKLFLWWNLVWWSLPYDKPIGRQMRFILWDNYHNAPFGLIGLQSPPLASSVRDKYLELNNGNSEYWINQSMYGQRIGALPPYNELLGGKMVALSLTSNELRKSYAKKYENKKTLLKKRKIPNRLLFITTTSAFGKSSVYERIKYKEEIVSYFIGFTLGSGTFHLPQQLYEESLLFLQQKGIDIKRGYGTGPSRKLKLVSIAFKHLKIPTFTFHNIKRGYYFFPHAKNLRNVIHKNKRPLWYNRPFKELLNFWIDRWCIPRSERTETWKQFDSNKFFRRVNLQIKRL
jgi:hypothetical protein